MQEQQPEPRVLPPRMTEGVQGLTEPRRDETTTPAPRVPTAFEQSLRQFMGQENIGVSALAKRLGKSHGRVSEWLTGKSVCSTQAEVLHELGLGPPPPELPTPAPRVPTAFEQSLRQFMGQENIGGNALAKRLGKPNSTVSEWLSGKSVCSTQAEVLHKLGLGPPPPAAGRVRRRPRSRAAAGRIRRAVRALQPVPLGQLPPPLVVAIKKERV
eukprot:COSAG03_NODE_646_length_6508_cov_43.951318_5_plen_213_part_00